MIQEGSSKLASVPSGGGGGAAASSAAAGGAAAAEAAPAEEEKEEEKEESDEDVCFFNWGKLILDGFRFVRLEWTEYLCPHGSHVVESFRGVFCPCDPHPLSTLCFNCSRRAVEILSIFL